MDKQEQKSWDTSANLNLPTTITPVNGGVDWWANCAIFEPPQNLTVNGVVGERCILRKVAVRMNVSWKPQWTYQSNGGKTFRFILFDNTRPIGTTANDNMNNFPILERDTPATSMSWNNFRNLNYTEKYKVLVDDTFTLSHGSFVPNGALETPLDPWGVNKGYEILTGESKITGLADITTNVPFMSCAWHGYQRTNMTDVGHRTLDFSGSSLTSLAGTLTTAPWTGTATTNTFPTGRIEGDLSVPGRDKYTTFNYDSEGVSTASTSIPATSIPSTLEFPDEEEGVTQNFDGVRSNWHSGGVLTGDSCNKEYYVDLDVEWRGTNLNDPPQYKTTEHKLGYVLLWSRDEFGGTNRPSPAGIQYPIKVNIKTRVRFTDE